MIEPEKEPDFTTEEDEFNEEEGTEKVEDKMETEFSCDKCNKTFPILSNLLQHVRDQHSKEEENSIERPFTCELCNHSFKSIYHLTRHSLEVHKHTIKRSGFDNNSEELKIKNPKRHTCDICYKVFKRNEHLKRHRYNPNACTRQQMVTKEKKQSVLKDCLICHKSFGSKYHLE